VVVHDGWHRVRTLVLRALVLGTVERRGLGFSSLVLCALVVRTLVVGPVVVRALVRRRLGMIHA
jgi:hypothetical protein